jgi:hypothetical protein
MNYTYFLETHDQRNINRIEIGALKVPSGKIIACDPLEDYDRRPYSRQVPKGEYPVFLYRDADDNAIGMAKLKISDKKPVHWEMALLNGQDISKLPKDGYFGFYTNNSISCFVDAVTADLYLECMEAVKEQLGDDFIDYYENVLADEFKKNDDIYVNHFPSIDSKLNVIMFSSGWDGCFASYWGLDEEGEVCCLLTDFNLFEKEELEK